MADREVDPLVLSRKGKLGGSEVFIGVRVGRHSTIFQKGQESWPKVGHAAREMVTVYSVTFLY